MTLRPGQILGKRYRIDRKIGQGGFGTVYQAWDINMQAAVAIKENLQTDAQMQRLFEKEARLLFKLRHPNLPVVLDHFPIPGQGVYLVMDYVVGEDLQSMLKRWGGPLPANQVIAWIGQVADALHYLHSQNPSIVHRDVKPANIRITPDGRAILVDFGIAKAVNPGVSTTADLLAITPGYSPPEQYGSSKAHPSNDVYALAATTYHLLTGRMPPTSVEISAGAVEPPTPPSQLNPGVPSAVDEVIANAMRFNQAERTGSVQVYRTLLENAFIAGQTDGLSHTVQLPDASTQPPAYQHMPGGIAKTDRVPITPIYSTVEPPLLATSPLPVATKPARNRWLAWAAAGAAGLILLFILIGLGMYLAWQSFAGAASATALAQGAQTPALTAAPSTKPATSPSSTTTIAAASTATLQPPPILPQPTVLLAADGSSLPRPKTPISLSNADQLQIVGRWKIDGRTIYLDFSPDGRWLGAGTYQVNQGGRAYQINLGDPAQPAAPRYMASTTGVDCVAFSPDSQTLALGNWGGQVGLIDAAVKKITYLPVASFKKGIWGLAFRPNASELTWATEGGVVGAMDPQRVDQPPAQRYQATGSVREIAYSPDGRWLAVGDDSGQITLLDGLGNIIQTMQLSEAVSSLAFSPRGDRLAAGGTNPAGNPLGELMVWDVQSGQPVIESRQIGAAIGRVLFAADDSLVITMDASGHVCFWPLQNTPRPACQKMGSPAIALAISSDGSLLAGGDTAGNILIWGIP